MTHQHSWPSYTSEDILSVFFVSPSWQAAPCNLTQYISVHRASPLSPQSPPVFCLSRIPSYSVKFWFISSLPTLQLYFRVKYTIEIRFLLQQHMHNLGTGQLHSRNWGNSSRFLGGCLAQGGEICSNLWQTYFIPVTLQYPVHLSLSDWPGFEPATFSIMGLCLNASRPASTYDFIMF